MSMTRTIDPKVEEITKDILERDGETFIQRRKDGRINWEETIAEGEALSSYFLKNPTNDDVYKKAYEIASDTVKVMEPDRKMNIRLHRDSSMTNGRDLYVATDFFDDESLTPGEKVDIFTGFTVHEGCHLLHTDFSVMGESEMQQNLCNILEDERIERLLGDSHPGLAGYLAKTKEYAFGRNIKKFHAMLKKQSLTVRCTNDLVGLIRYPKLLDDAEIMDMYDYLRKVRDLVIPYPASTKECMETAAKIEDLILDEYKKEERKKEEKEEKEGMPSPKKRSGSSAEKDSSSDDPHDGEKTSSRTPGKDDCKKEPSAGEASEHSTGKPEKMKDASGKGSGETAGRSEEEINMEAAEKMMGDFHAAREYLSSLSQTDSSKKESEAIRKDETFESVVNGSLERGTEKDTFFRKAKDNRPKYEKALESVKQYVPAIKSALKYHCYESSHDLKGMKTGQLDTSKLVEAVIGDSNVYIQQRNVKCNRKAICILVDESGSMIRENRATAARQTAVLLNEALKDIKQLDLFIYGHTADVLKGNSTELMIYREKSYAPRYALGEIEARDNNRDGSAILETARRVRKMTKEQVLFFIISDGAPAAQGYVGKGAIKHTRDCVKQVEAMGFTPVQVCISPSYDPKLMFDDFVILNDMKTLAPQLAKIIKDKLMTQIKKRSSVA